MRSTRRRQNSRQRSAGRPPRCASAKRAIEQEAGDDEEHRDTDVETGEVVPAAGRGRRSRRRATWNTTIDPAAIGVQPVEARKRVAVLAHGAGSARRRGELRVASRPRSDHATRSSGRSSRNQLADAVTSVQASAVVSTAGKLARNSGRPCQLTAFPTQA